MEKINKWDKEKILNFSKSCSSKKDILIQLGFKPCYNNYNKLNKIFSNLNINFITNKKTIKWDKDNIIEIVNTSESYRDCLEKLKIRKGGGNFKTLKKYIKIYNIDIQHFKKNRICKKYKLEDVLIKDSSYSRTTLKKRLYNCGLLKPICSLCGQDENWNNMKISLIIDHINGIYNDNRLENLRIVCPNCNAGLPTFAGKNFKRYKKPIQNYYCNCGKEIGENSKKCIKCHSFSKRKVEHPELDILLKDVSELGYSGTGRKYGVSDNSIRKWIKNS